MMPIVLTITAGRVEAEKLRKDKKIMEGSQGASLYHGAGDAR